MKIKCSFFHGSYFMEVISGPTEDERAQVIDLHKALEALETPYPAIISIFPMTIAPDVKSQTHHQVLKCDNINKDTYEFFKDKIPGAPSSYHAFLSEVPKSLEEEISRLQELIDEMQFEVENGKKAKEELAKFGLPERPEKRIDNIEFDFGNMAYQPEWIEELQDQVEKAATCKNIIERYNDMIKEIQSGINKSRLDLARESVADARSVIAKIRPDVEEKSGPTDEKNPSLS